MFEKQLSLQSCKKALLINLKMKYIIYFTGLILFLALIFCFQTTNEYHFYYIEQLQLFQLSWQYIAKKLIYPGGFSLLAGEFFLQYFTVPYVGAIVFSALLVGVTIFTQKIIKCITPSVELWGLSFLPMLALLLVQYDINYYLQGTVAYLLMLVFFYSYICIKSFKYRLALGVFQTPLLFWWGGSVALLFLIGLVLWELFSRVKKKYLIILPVIIFCGLVFGSIHGAILPEYRFAFLPDLYYHPQLNPPALIYLSWGAFPVVLLVAFLCRKIRISTTKSKIINITVQGLLIALLCIWSIPRYNKADSYQLKKLDYYVRTQQWDAIIDESAGPLNNYLYICQLNLALMERGEFADRLFFFDQHGVDGLLRPWDKTFVVSNLLSDIYFSLGDIALAQRTAFEALTTVHGDVNPRNLKRLVQTNLIYGSYPVAEKYIAVLERTFAYKEWAKAHRKFLYDDAAVAADPLLGAKRQGLTANNHMSQLDGVIPDLIQQAEENPINQLPIQFVGVTYLLSKDLASFQHMIEKYYGTPVLPKLPHSFQEAVIMLSENDPDYWLRFDVSDVVIQRFMTYRETVLRNRNNSQALPTLLRNSYANTYWYYYIYK